MTFCAAVGCRHESLQRLASRNGEHSPFVIDKIGRKDCLMRAYELDGCVFAKGKQCRRISFGIKRCASDNRGSCKVGLYGIARFRIEDMMVCAFIVHEVAFVRSAGDGGGVFQRNGAKDAAAFPRSPRQARFHRG